MGTCPHCAFENVANARLCGNCGLYLLPIGPYVLVRPIGEGGFAEVFQGRHQETGALCAIKILHRRFAHEEDFKKRFLREVRVMQALDDPGIVKIVDFGSREDLGLYMAMEWLDGVTLREHVKHAPQARLAGDEARALLAELLRALQKIHDVGIIHRDIKPNNMMMVDGTLKLLDFGIAWIQGEESLTRSNMYLGSTRFMAPEQFQERKDLFGPSTDLYAVGILFAWMLTGQFPFAGLTFEEVAAQHLMHHPPPLKFLCPDASFPLALEAVVSYALRKDPHQRFQSAQAFLQAVEAPQAFLDQLNLDSRRELEDSIRTFSEKKPAFLPSGEFSQSPSSALPLATGVQSQSPEATQASLPSHPLPQATATPVPIAEPSGSPGAAPHPEAARSRTAVFAGISLALLLGLGLGIAGPWLLSSRQSPAPRTPTHRTAPARRASPARTSPLRRLPGHKSILRSTTRPKPRGKGLEVSTGRSPRKGLSLPTRRRQRRATPIRRRQRRTMPIRRRQRRALPTRGKPGRGLRLPPPLALSDVPSLFQRPSLYLQRRRFQHRLLRMIPRLPRSTRMRIYSVNLSFSPVGDHQFIYLRPLERLRFLILNKTRFRGHGLRQLRHLKHLWRINLNYSRIDDRGLRALARFPALRHLELRYCKAVTFRGLQALGASKTLRILHFQQNSHIAQSDREICRAIPSLRYVSRFYRLRCR